MKIHFSHKRYYLQLKNTFECLSIIFLISGGILIVYHPPIIKSVQEILWFGEIDNITKLLLGIGVTLLALKLFLESLYKTKIYDWSLVYPELKGFYKEQCSDKKALSTNAIDIHESLDSLLSKKNPIDKYLVEIKKVDAVGQKILKLRSEIDKLKEYS
jgi:hypothetical protein